MPSLFQSRFLVLPTMPLKLESPNIILASYNLMSPMLSYYVVKCPVSNWASNTKIIYQVSTTCICVARQGPSHKPEFVSEAYSFYNFLEVYFKRKMSYFGQQCSSPSHINVDFVFLTVYVITRDLDIYCV